MKLTLILAALGAILFVLPASAKPVSPTLSVSPTPVVAHTDYHLTGCGYGADTPLVVQITSPTAYSQSGAQAGSDGCFDDVLTALGDGAYTAVVWIPSKPNKPAASLDFTVTP